MLRLTATYKNEIVSTMATLDDDTHERRFVSIKGKYLRGIITQLETFTALYELLKGSDAMRNRDGYYVSVSQFETCMRKYLNLK